LALPSSTRAMCWHLPRILGTALSFAVIENGRRVLFTRTAHLV
jgi:hypothetical protein